METWAPDENPVLIRHVHTRLRRGGAISAAVLVGIAGLGFVALGEFIASRNGTPAEETARVLFFALLAVPGLLLLLAGTNRVSLAITMERNSGILESLRLTPMHPGVTLAGYVAGAPLQEIAASLVAIPFLFYCILRGGIAFVDAVQWGVALGSTALLFYLLASVSALTGAPGRTPSKAIGGILLFFLVFGVPNFIRVFSMRPGRPDPATHTFFGAPLPLLFHVLLWQGFLIVFLAIAATRKLAREGAPGLSKRQTVLFHLILLVFFLGSTWSWLLETARGVAGTGAPLHPFLPWLIGVGAAGWIAGFWLSAMMTPKEIAFRREEERSRARGERVRPGSEGASQTRWTLALAALLSVFLLIPPAFLLATGTVPSEAILLVPALLTITLVVFGASRECFALLGRKHAGGIQLVLIAALWGGPMILGAVVGLGDETAGGLTSGLSPLGGLVGAFTAADEYPRSLVGPYPATVAIIALVAQAVLAAFFLRRLRGIHRRIRERIADRLTPPPEPADS